MHFEAIFRASPNPYVLLTLQTSPSWRRTTPICASPADSERSQLLGRKKMFEACSLPILPPATTGTCNELKASFDRVS